MNPRWGAYAPWPFVGATALLAVLILLTPALISIGEPAPGILTQGELGIDGLLGSNVTGFYVRPLSDTVRYAAISAGIDENASNINWTGSGRLNWSALQFTRYANATDVLVLGFNSTANPVAVNVTACYASSSGDELYHGEAAFYLGATRSNGDTLFGATNTAGVTVPASTPIADLPLWIALSAIPTACGAPP